MLRKLYKLVLSSCLLVSTVPNAFLLTKANVESIENLAKNKTVTVSNYEIDAWNGSKAVDGIVNREAEKLQQSRWSTNQLNGNEPAWIQIDLGEVKTFQSFVIAWERRNIESYRIQVSDNLEENSFQDVYVKNNRQEISDINETIHLEEATRGRYVKLLIDGYNGNHTVGGGGEWKSVSLYEFQVYENEIPSHILPDENYALEAEATASDVENNNPNALAKYAIDGNDTTRWATNTSNSMEKRELVVTLPVSQRIQYFRILFERTNIKDFSISISNDNHTYTDVFSKSDNQEITDTLQYIDLNKPVWAKYIKLSIHGYTGGDIQWPNVSVNEFQIKAKPFVKEELPTFTETNSAEEVANQLPVPKYNPESMKFVWNETPEIFQVDLLVDYEQIVEADGTVHQPLHDINLKGIYSVTKASDSTKAESKKEFSLLVPGKYESTGINQKPTTVPEIVQWVGGEGVYTLSQGKILVSSHLPTSYLFAAEELSKDLADMFQVNYVVEQGDQPQEHDIYFAPINRELGLKEEGYQLDVSNHIRISFEHETGAYWATRTILQVLKLYNRTFPQGIARDFPKFKLRGFMIDVARKPISYEMLESIMKQMAFYKLNDLQLHLNDNLIFMEDYADLETAMEQSYTGFRVESDIKKGGNEGKNQADLTNEDLFYTKQQLRNFILESRKRGIQVVPEFDTPGHAGAMIKVRPDLHLKELKSNQHLQQRAGEQFDLSPDHYADSFQFVTDLWDEYLTEEMFDSSMTVNIGTDEYFGDKERFRLFSDDLIQYVQGKNRTVRMWGSLTGMPGSTPVRSKNVQVNIWNTGWANPQQMYRDGFDLINMVDGPLYIVPRPIQGNNYYNDYINTRNIFENWQPNKFGNVVIPAGSKQMLGSAFALWNDQIDTRANGISEIDIYDRFAKAVPTFALKTWGSINSISYDQLQSAENVLGDAPNHNPYKKHSSVDNTYVQYVFEEGLEQEDLSNNNRDIQQVENISYENERLKLHSQTSYVTTPLQQISTGSTLSFEIELNQDPKPGDILFESDHEGNHEYSHDIRIMEDLTLGFTRELYDYSFQYRIPLHEKKLLKITTDGTKTTLFVDGKAYPAVGKYVDDKGRLKKEGITSATFLLPMQRIGSKTNAIEAYIDNVSLSAEVYQDNSKLHSSEFEVTSTNENALSSNRKEGPIALAFDDNETTHWHTNYTPYQPLPAEVLIRFNHVEEIEKFTYLPRQDGQNNGIITKYSMYYQDASRSDQWLPIIEHGEWSFNQSLKTVTFDPIQVSAIKFVAEEGASNQSDKMFASAAEFAIHRKVGVTNITLNHNNYELEANDQVQLIATVNTDTNISWKSGNEEIATVDEQGLVTTKQPGITNIYAIATDGSIVSCKLIVKEKLNFELLKDMIQQYENYTPDNYTKESWEAFETARNKAKDILNRTDITQYEIDQACEDLKTAAQQLVERNENVVNKDKLYQLLKQYENYHQKDFTMESWNVFYQAYEHAKQIYENKNATQKMVDDAVVYFIMSVEQLEASSLEIENNQQVTQAPNVTGAATFDHTKENHIIFYISSILLFAVVLQSKRRWKKS